MDTWTIEQSHNDELPALMLFEAYVKDVPASTLCYLDWQGLFNPTAQVVYAALLAMAED